jgi:hypothetical protein
MKICVPATVLTLHLFLRKEQKGNNRGLATFSSLKIPTLPVFID